MEPEDIIDLIPLDKNNNDLAKKIVNEDNVEKVQNLVHLFNLNQQKKNVIRILKLNSLLDKVSDNMLDRFENHSDEFNNTDLLNYMQVIQNAIEKSNKNLNLVDETPAITMNQININVDKEEPLLNKESRDRVTDAVKEIMKKLNLKNDESEEHIILEQDSLNQPLTDEDKENAIEIQNENEEKFDTENKLKEEE